MPTIFEPDADDTDESAPPKQSRLRSWVDSNIGKTIAGKYEIVRCLGTGGMGGVFLARHTLLPGSFFALKLIIPRPHSGPPDEQEKRFTREARTAMQFVHPRAAQVRDFGFDHDRGLMYMAMDYLEGRRLDQVLAAAVASNAPGRPVIEVDRALRITYLILDALGAAHAADVIHRDLKPGNVLLVGSGAAEDVRILDFGCAKMVNAANRREHLELPGERTRVLTDSITEKGIVMGTVQYMAPEQARGEKLDPRADLYSIGVMLYEMLTGRLPHEAKRHNLLILARALRPSIPLTRARPDIAFHPLVNETVEKALSMKRKERFGSAEEFARSVEAALADAATPAPTEDPTPSGPKPPSRAPRSSTVSLPADVPAGASSPVSRIMGPARRIAVATGLALALLAIAWLIWTRVAYSILMARGESAVARDDFPAGLLAFERAHEIRPGAPLARELAVRALAERALRRAEERARLGDLPGLCVELSRAWRMGADGGRIAVLEGIASSATKMAEVQRLMDARRYSQARALLEGLPSELPEPWATRASSQRTAVDAKLSEAERLLGQAVKHSAKSDREAQAVASAALSEFLKGFPNHPRRAEALLLRARAMTRIAPPAP